MTNEISLFQRALVHNSRTEHRKCQECIYCKEMQIDKYISHCGYYCELTGEGRWRSEPICFEFIPIRK